MEPVHEDFPPEEYDRMRELLTGNVSKYVRNSPDSTNTQLFGFLALLNRYIHDSYLLMSECQKILGPPDPIHGGPPFELRMEPFTQFIRRSTDDEHICIHPEFAETALEVMVNSGATRSTTVKILMESLCGDEPQPDTIEFVKDLLTKREMGERRREKFSGLIQDICGQENHNNVISVLKTASNIMRGHAIFPQTLSRFYYIERNITQCNYETAEKWARIAIGRAPKNSNVANTLGQVFKNRFLRSATQPEDSWRMANVAWQAFKEVEEKANREVGPDMVDDADASITFNNRGRFGLIQVAKIAHEKLQGVNDPQQRYGRKLQKYRMEVEDNFDFFEWYLTYSKPDKTFLEPPYFWKDVAYCYNLYTGASAADSTSFPGLLECLNHGLFTSRGRYSQLEESQKTLPELETICNELRTTYEENVDDDDAAERYVLSNVILSNRAPNSPSLTPLAELQGILSRFLGRDAEHRCPEFYLLVLLLFWPQEHPEVVQEEDEEEGEEVEEPETAEDSSDDETWEDQDTPEDQETEGQAAQPPQEVKLEAALQQYVTSMGRAFDNHYSKYLRGRYLVPLFFLGKGVGLSKWIHRSKLDAIVETEVDAQLALEGNRTRKWERINGLWSTGKVWQIPAVQQILLPVMTDPPHPSTILQEQQENKVFVFAGGRRILATTEYGSDAQAPTPLYLGLTIQGPVVFKQHVGTSSEFGG